MEYVGLLLLTLLLIFVVLLGSLWIVDSLIYYYFYNRPTIAEIYSPTAQVVEWLLFASVSQFNPIVS